MSQDSQTSSRQYRRGAVMGLTVAEIFLLLAFILLMLMMLWRAESEHAVTALQEALGYDEETRRDIVEVTRTFEAAGVSLHDAALRDKIEVFFNVEASETGRKILMELAAAPEEERRRLVELIGDESLREEIETLRERIRGRLVSAEAARADVASALREALGATVRAAGGEIAADGALVFPDTVLFAPGSAAITPDLRAFLSEVCLPWFRTLEASGASISELRIEGHASSEWDVAGLIPPERAYLLNLALSQERAHAVLSTCLELVPGAEGAWARERATAIGFSSSRPVMVGGEEDRPKSRRVVFSVAFSQDQVLEDIGSDIAGADPERENMPGIGQSPASRILPVAAPGPAEADYVGIPSVIDGDTLQLQGARLRLHGIDAPELGQTCLDGSGASFPCGQVAASALADRIGNSTTECTQLDTDQYRRPVVLCRVGGDDLGAWMVGQGFAYAYRRYSNDYEGLEGDARALGAGFWSGTFEAPWDQR
jgi:endonuclease YncB( thermonuclease family)/outer membrane protein OmpA-like peptidoglycan-associated protein